MGGLWHGIVEPQSSIASTDFHPGPCRSSPLLQLHLGLQGGPAVVLHDHVRIQGCGGQGLLGRVKDNSTITHPFKNKDLEEIVELLKS